PLPACAEAIAAWVGAPRPGHSHPGEQALPEARTDAIYTYFGLSYANYLVLPRTLASVDARPVADPVRCPAERDGRGVPAPPAGGGVLRDPGEVSSEDRRVGIDIGEGTHMVL